MLVWLLVQDVWEQRKEGGQALAVEASRHQ
jgi:hypothetical protein